MYYNEYGGVTPSSNEVVYDFGNTAGGGGSSYIDPTPVQEQTPSTPVYSTDEVFVSEPIDQTIEPVSYVDPGGAPIDYVQQDYNPDAEIQPQLLPASEVQTVVDPGSATTTETGTDTTPTPTSNKLTDWIKANPLLAGGIGLGLLLLLTNKKQKAL